MLYYAKKQQTGFGSMLSFEFAGSFEQLKVFVKELQLFSLAESLGALKQAMVKQLSERKITIHE